MKDQKIKVLVVDDSALIRSVLKEIINREIDMECVGAAPDPLVARELIKALNPDVLRQLRECGEVANLDRRVGLCPRRHRQEMMGPKMKSP